MHVHVLIYIFFSYLDLMIVKQFFLSLEIFNVYIFTLCCLSSVLNFTMKHKNIPMDFQRIKSVVFTISSQFLENLHFYTPYGD